MRILSTIRGILAIGLICALNNAEAQNYIPYYNLVNEAEYAIFQNNYSEGAQKLEKAFKLEKPHAKDAYLLSYCLSKIDSIKYSDRIRQLIIYTSENNGATTHWMKVQPLSISFDTAFYKEIEQKEATCHSESRAMNDTIDYYLDRDQEIRKVITDSIRPYYGDEGPEYQAYIAKMSRNDSIYQTQFLRYIKVEGYPGINRCGSDVSGVMLVHIHPSLFEEYRSVLLEELKKGNIEPFSYGSMVDRINCFINGEAFYYAYTISSDNCQPSNPEIISNRISIGMSPYFQGPRRHVKFLKRQLLVLP